MQPRNCKIFDKHRHIGFMELAPLPERYDFMGRPIVCAEIKVWDKEHNPIAMVKFSHEGTSVVFYTIPRVTMDFKLSKDESKIPIIFYDKPRFSQNITTRFAKVIAAHTNDIDTISKELNAVCREALQNSMAGCCTTKTQAQAMIKEWYIDNCHSCEGGNRIYPRGI